MDENEKLHKILKNVVLGTLFTASNWDSHAKHLAMRHIVGESVLQFAELMAEITNEKLRVACQSFLDSCSQLETDCFDTDVHVDAFEKLVGAVEEAGWC